jgi:hypothetical protein
MHNTNGFGQTERFIEIPWCLNRVNGAQTVLDIGYANAEPYYLEGLANQRIPELHGLDIVAPKYITVTEPNGVTRPLLNPAQGDFQALQELCRITKPGGRFIVTVPFGKAENHGWFRQYDMDRLMRLCTSSDLQLSEAHFFKYQNGWHECFPYELQGVGYQTNGACNAAGLACVELRKTI